ncbi:MAG: HlyD family efflux transporter periplasmic adaptor subunit, partial [Aeoliella sp.]
QLHVAEQQRKAAIARFNDEIEKLYAIAASKAARANYDELLEANSGGIDNVVPATELRSAELEWKRAELQIQKADKDKQLAGYEYWIRKAEKEAAQMEIDRRVIKAPFAGEVMELFKKQGEWVNPGDPILQYVRYDVLQCDGKVNFDEYDPREVEGCDVTIEVEVGRGRIEQAQGRISHVEQQVQYEGRYTYRVQAEIPNRMDAGRWLLLPGLSAKMTIHLGSARANLGRAE